MTPTVSGDSRVLGQSRSGRTGVWPVSSRRSADGSGNAGAGRNGARSRARGHPSPRLPSSPLPVEPRGGSALLHQGHGGSGGGRPGPEPATPPCSRLPHRHSSRGRLCPGSRAPPGQAKGGEPCSPVSPPDLSHHALPLGPWHPHSRTKLAIPNSSARRTPEPAARLTHSPDATQSLQAVAALGPHPPRDDRPRFLGCRPSSAQRLCDSGS